MTVLEKPPIVSESETVEDRERVLAGIAQSIRVAQAIGYRIPEEWSFSRDEANGS